MEDGAGGTPKTRLAVHSTLTAAFLKDINMKKILILAALLAVSTLRAQDHGHINAGASGGTLIIDNYDDFIGHKVALNYVPLDYVYPGTGTNLAKYAGYFQGNVTFTVLAATSANAGPEPNAPALGSYIHLQLVSVSGPDGGSFGFWESGAPAPTYSMLADAGGGADLWRLSNNNGVAGTDPFGHIHGRRFTVDTPGEYVVGFRLVDLSTNGPGGAPIYGNPSEVYYFAFSAVPEPATGVLLLLGLGAVVPRKRRS